MLTARIAHTTRTPSWWPVECDIVARRDLVGVQQRATTDRAVDVSQITPWHSDWAEGAGSDFRLAFEANVGLKNHAREVSKERRSL